MRCNQTIQYIAGSAIAISILALGGCGASDSEAHKTVGPLEQALDDNYLVDLDFPSGFDETTVALHSASSLNVADGIDVIGQDGVVAPVLNVGTGPVEVGADGRTGSLVSGGTVSLRSRARVEGDVQASGDIVTQDGVVVSGSQLPNTPLGPLSSLSFDVDFPQASGSLSLEPDQSGVLAPGAYTNVVAKSRAVLSLQAGEYFLDHLQLESGAVLDLDTSAGPVIVYVRGTLIFRGQTRITGADSSFLLAYLGSDSISIEAPFNGTLLAPSASLRLGSVASPGHRGSFFAQSLQVEAAHSTLAFDPFDDWDRFGGDTTPVDPCKSESPAFVHSYFNPTVLDAGAPDSTVVPFNARVVGPDTELELNTAAGVVPLTDDDGDCVYTANLTQGEVLARYNPATDVQRAIVGQLSVLGVNRNVLVSVHSNDLPSCSPVAHGSGVQSCPHVANIVLSDWFDRSLDINAAVRAFYETFGDDYDFVNVVSELTYPFNRAFTGTKNEVSGIGLPLFDDTAVWGSAGRLRGVIRFPIPTFFDGAASAASHEIGHCWINFLDFPLLGQAASHWPISDLAHGIMGRSTPGGQGLSFPYLLLLDPETGVVERVSDPDPKAFKDLSLYLMGLIPASEVSEHFVMESQSPDAFPSSDFTQFSIEDVLAVDGPRSPAFGQSQTDFATATVVVSRELLSQEAMELFDFFAARAESTADTVATHEGLAFETARPFFSATGGRATLDATLVGP